MSGKTEGRRVRLTAARVAGFECPADKAQAFLWDDVERALAVRVSRGGKKTFIFQSRLKGGESLRLTIGNLTSGVIDIAAMRAEARRLQGLIDQGRDPRAVREEVAEADRTRRAAADTQRQQQREEERRAQVRGLDAWADYCTARASQWGERHARDHAAMVRRGGKQRQRRSPGVVTGDGPLCALLDQPLASIGPAEVQQWLERERAARPTVTALAFRLLRAFLAWCGESDGFKTIAQADACSRRVVVETVPRPKAKAGDCLQREQLRAWFGAVRTMHGEVMSAYLQCLLLTGARREEMAELRWEDVDFQWNSLRIRCKVEGQRTIPLTPYVRHLLAGLPRRSGWVFSSPSAKSGHLTSPTKAHDQALSVAGLPSLTVHGLRRSFGTLCEWVEVPVGVVYQIEGRRPSATAEKHYRRRPLDLLREWHTRIEAWMLHEAGIEQPPAGAAVVPLRIVGGAA